MPLTATLDGSRIVAPLLTDEEWSHVKNVADCGDQSRLRIGYSDLPCYPRTSKAGVRHFVHRNGFIPDVKYQTETAQHLKLKSAVVRAASELGWDARTEVMSQDRSWVADTLMTKGSVTIAVEIQWSSQNLEEYQRRQQRYADANIRCAWIYRHSRTSEHLHNDSLPMFQVDEGTVNYDPEIIIDGIMDGSEVHRVSFRRFIETLLSGQVQLSVRTEILPDSCYRCSALHTIWLTEFSPMFQLDQRMEFSPAVMTAVAAVVDQQGLPPMCTHKVMATKAAKVEYDAFTCPSCGSVLGDYFIHQQFSPEIGRTPHVVLSRSQDSWADHGRWMVSSPHHSSVKSGPSDHQEGFINTDESVAGLTGWDRY